MKKTLIYALLPLLALGCNSNEDAQQKNSTDITQNALQADTSAYQMVWAEEFNEAVIDTTKWSFQLGDGCPGLCGWGNNELQYYTNSLRNARVENGHLVIQAHKEATQGSNYSSAKLISKGKGDWQYGKMLIKAKLPKGTGTWPAIWMLPSLDRPLRWPLDGEIDIMEHVGFDQGNVHGTIHTEAYNGMIGTQLSGTIALATPEDIFYEYGLEWTPEKLVWLVDGKEYFKIDNPHKTDHEWPFDKPYHLILNLAVGGNWGGREGIDENIWPQRMQIDYVRVYQYAQK